MSATIDVSAVIERAPLGRFHARTLAIALAAMALDGFDVQAISYVAPALKLAEPVTREALGPVFSASLFGLMLGAMAVGYLADVIGRRRSIAACLIGFGVLSMMTAHVDTIRELLVLRFLTGLMLGGVMPNAVSLVTEYAPRHRRALAGTITVCGFSAGAALGGILAGLILGSFSWRAVFYVGGIGPLIVAAFVIVWLPESARFLVLAGAQPARIAKLLRQVDPGRSFGADDRFLLAEERQHGFAVSQLFHGGRALPTLLLWLAFFMNNVVLYGLTNWLPIVLRDDGVPVSQAVTITAMFQVGGTIGLIIIGRLCDAFAGRLVVALSFLCAAIAVALIGVIPGSVLLLGAVILAAGLFVVGGQGGTITIAGALYPTAIRSTGIGWGLGAARLGGVFGPLLGPMLLAQNWGTPMLFVTAAIPAVIASIAVVSVISRRPEADTIVTAPLAGGEA